MQNLDATDTKILDEIAENARITTSKLAKKARCSREVAAYRLKRLQENGTIQGYSVRVNLSQFIHGGYMIVFRLTNLTEQREKDLVQYLKKNTFTVWLGRTSGQWDFLWSFVTTSQSELIKTIGQLKQEVGEDLEDYEVITMVDEYKDTFRPAFSKKHQQIQTITTRSTHKIDTKDMKLLYALHKDCRRPLHVFSKKVGLSVEATRKRIHELEKNQVIIGYRTMMHQASIGGNAFFIMLKLDVTNIDDERMLKEYFSTHKHVFFANRTVGLADIICVVFADGLQEFDRVTRAIRDDLNKKIRSIITMNLHDVLIHQQLPHELIEESLKNTIAK